MLQQFKRIAHLYFLRKELKFHHAERKTVKLREAKEIGILFNATNTDEAAIVTKFADSLRAENKRTVLLGFYNFPKPAINFTFPYFNKKNLNWFLEPDGSEVKHFVERKFDILINAYVGEILPLEYISALSQSGFRIGHYDRHKTYAYDFMIDMKDRNDLPALMKEIRHYLQMV